MSVTGSGWVARNRRWIAAVTILILGGILLASPASLYFWSYRGFQTLFHDDFGAPASLSSVLAVVAAFLYASASPLVVLRWFASGRRTWRAFFAVFLFFATTPLLHWLFDSNFNQRTQESQKWYVWLGRCDIKLSDSPGFDPITGRQKSRYSTDVAEIVERCNKGIIPKSVTDDVRGIRFFDSITAAPLIWFHRQSDGTFALFDDKGFYFGTGDPLEPVSPKIRDEILRQADKEHQIAALRDRTAEENHVVIESEAERTRLGDLLGLASYSSGSTVVGVKAGDEDADSLWVAQRVRDMLVAKLRAEKSSAQELVPGFYASRYFEDVLAGREDVILKAGTSTKVPKVLAGSVTSRCHSSAALSAAVTCRIDLELRVINTATGTSRSFNMSDTGVGSNDQDALLRGAQQLVAGLGSEVLR